MEYIIRGRLFSVEDTIVQLSIGRRASKNINFDKTASESPGIGTAFEGLISILNIARFTWSEEKRDMVFPRQKRVIELA